MKLILFLLLFYLHYVRAVDDDKGTLLSMTDEINHSLLSYENMGLNTFEAHMKNEEIIWFLKALNFDQFFLFNKFITRYYTILNENDVKQHKRFRQSIVMQSIRHANVFYIMAQCWFHQVFDIRGIYNMTYLKQHDVRNLCPNACNLDRCDAILHAVKGSCRTVPFMSFNCSCVSPYQWSQKEKSCDLPKKCPECDMKNLTCISAVFESQTKGFTYKCVNKSELMDPCLNLLSLHTIDGVTACANGKCVGLNSYLRGRAEPFKFIANFTFECDCDNKYEKDPRLPYPNCAKKIDQCKNLNCGNGVCRITMNNFTRCECKDGWTGRDCSTPFAVWNDWSLWSQCSPKCSAHRTKTRSRTCPSRRILDCLSENSEREINDYEIRLCSKHFCLVEGNWTSWSSWSPCLAHCGESISTAERFCVYDSHLLDQPGAYKHKPCVGSHIKIAKCILRSCVSYYLSVFATIAVIYALMLLPFMATFRHLYKYKQKTKSRLNKTLEEYKINLHAAKRLIAEEHTRKQKVKVLALF